MLVDHEVLHLTYILVVRSFVTLSAIQELHVAQTFHLLARFLVSLCVLLARVRILVAMLIALEAFFSVLEVIDFATEASAGDITALLCSGSRSSPERLSVPV